MNASAGSPGGYRVRTRARRRAVARRVMPAGSLLGPLVLVLAMVLPGAAASVKGGSGQARSSTSSTLPALGGSVEQWGGSRSALFDLTPRGGSTATSGREDLAASDGRALALTIPAEAGATPANAAEVVSDLSYLYGSFTTRLRTADCSRQPTTGAVTGVFTYANDGTDRDGDGLPDNAEIDVEILCAQPWVVYLSIWTDYRDSDGAQRRVTRAVDLRNGRILSTAFFTSFDSDGIALSGAENDPATIPASPGLDTSTAYHVFRISWTADRVLFTVDEAGRSVPLWDYRGPWDRIPHRPSHFLVNLWHTSDWSPIDAPPAVAAPSAPLTTWVDWVEIS